MKGKAILALASTIWISSCATPPQTPKSQALPQAQALESWKRPDLVPVKSETQNIVFRGATILTANSERLEDADLWIRDGKIVALGLDIEATDAEEFDAKGLWITPGLIDTHSHLGVYPVPGVEGHGDGNEATSPNTGQVNALQSVWPQDPGFYEALKGGVTALQILPGSANLVGGLSATLQLRPAVSAQAMVFPGAPLGIKMACGENPKRVYGQKGGPSTRMGTYAAFRQIFQKVQDYQRARTRFQAQHDAWKNKPGAKASEEPQPPPLDQAMEHLSGVFRGEILAHVHCYRADEMIQILELAHEFGFSVRSFHHAVESYKIRDILAQWNVSTSTWADWWGFKMEAYDAIPQNAGLLATAGAKAIIHSDDAIGIQRLNQEAAKAYYSALESGLEITEDEALRWITANAAWALGIDHLTGTLEESKRADVVVWSHHPFSVYAKPQRVYVQGVLEYNREQPAGTWSDFLVEHTEGGQQ